MEVILLNEIFQNDSFIDKDLCIYVVHLMFYEVAKSDSTILLLLKIIIYS